MTLPTREHQKSFASGAREALQTDLFSLLQVCQHHYGRCLLLPNHAPKVSHRLQLRAWKDRCVYVPNKIQSSLAEAWNFTLSGNKFVLLFKTLRGKVNNINTLPIFQ